MKQKLRFVFIPALLLPLLTGCANLIVPRAPERQDSFAGINITKAGPAYPDMNLALILSENTKNMVAYGRKSSRLAGFDLAPMIEESFSLL